MELPIPMGASQVESRKKAEITAKNREIDLNFDKTVIRPPKRD
jgi:hypothetical protein